MSEPQEKRDADNRKLVAKSGDIPVVGGATPDPKSPSLDDPAKEGDAVLAKMLNTPKAKS